MPAKVEKTIRKLTSKGYSKSAAIRILKSKKAIKQAGKHLKMVKK